MLSGMVELTFDSPAAGGVINAFIANVTDKGGIARGSTTVPVGMETWSFFFHGVALVAPGMMWTPEVFVDSVVATGATVRVDLHAIGSCPCPTTISTGGS